MRNGVLRGDGKFAPKLKPLFDAKFAMKKLAIRKSGRVLVTLSHDEAQPTGTLLVLDGKRVVKRVRVTKNSEAVAGIRFDRLRPGLHLLKVKYSGDAGFTPAVSQTTRIRVR